MGADFLSEGLKSCSTVESVTTRGATFFVMVPISFGAG